jgi:outer membrane protein assembly factor BamB
LYTTLRTSSIANDRLIALSAINGTKIWEFNDPSKRNLFSEIIEGDNKLFVSTFGHDLYAFEK